MIIQVTKEDIKRGVPDDCHHCALARAINRYLRAPFVAEVTTGCAYILNRRDGTQTVLSYPQRQHPFISNWIERFDAQESVPEPFSISLAIPDFALRN